MVHIAKETIQTLKKLREAMCRVAQIEYTQALDIAIAVIQEKIDTEDDGK